MISTDSLRKGLAGSLWLAIAWVAATPVNAQTAAPGSSAGVPAAPSGVTRDPQIVIWTDALPNYLGSVAHNTAHDEFMVGWTTQHDQWSHDVWARRLRPDGTLLEHFNVAAVAGEALGEPEIEYCPLHDEYLIAYNNLYDGSGDFGDVQARRVAWNGGWMSDVFTLTPGIAKHVNPSIAYTPAGDEYVVTYTNEWPGGEIDLYAQRVRGADGALLSWNVVASGGGWWRHNADVAFHAAAYAGIGGYLIAYRAASIPSGDRVWYKMTRSDLSDLYTNPELEVSSTVFVYTGPQVAAGQTGFLVAWWEGGAGGWKVRARRISADGVALGPPEGFPVSDVYVSSPPLELDAVAVTYAFPGLYLAVWEHHTPAGTIGIHGIFVSEEADTTLGDEFELSGIGIANAAVTCSPRSDCLIAYEWWNSSSLDLAGDIARLVVMFEDGFESGDTSAWSATVP